MTEILTESFCERCGTRYTFEAAIPKNRRIGRLKVLSKGLKNYVLSEDASLDEALAEARSDEEREASGGQLDAFHQTFQFCMSCRQYTCANCWNEAEGRCLSCAPLSIVGGQLGSPLDDLLAGGGMASLANPALAHEDHAHSELGLGNGHSAELEPEPPALVASAWPTIDLQRNGDVAPPLEPAGEPDAVIELPAPEPAPGPPGDFWARPFTGYAAVPEPGNGHDHLDASLAAPVDEPLSEALVEPAGEPVPSPLEVAQPAVNQAADARATELAERTTRLLGRFRVQPRSAASGAAGPAPEERPAPPPEPPAQPAWMFVTAPAAEPVTQPEPEPVLAAEPEPVLAAEPATQPEPEPVLAAAPEPEPVVAPEPEPVMAAAPAWPSEVQPVVPDEPAMPMVAAAQVEDGPIEAAPPAPARAPIDRVEMPAWPTPARPALSDSAPLPAPSPTAPPVQAAPTPARPEAPQWPAPLRPDLDMSSTPFWASGAAGRNGADTELWTASAREVAGVPGQAVATVGVQSCVSCGLSLSATARFCRRCGSRQG